MVVVGLVGERIVKRGGDHFLRGVLAVVARYWAVDDAIIGELRCLGRILVGAIGVFLVVWLGVTIGYLVPGLCFVCILMGCC